mgnify:CR=1 FL=1
MKNRIMRFRYRVGKAPSEEVVATAKVCEKKKSELLKRHNGNIKFSKIVAASDYPSGAPHV